MILIAFSIIHSRKMAITNLKHFNFWIFFKMLLFVSQTVKDNIFTIYIYGFKLNKNILKEKTWF